MKQRLLTSFSKAINKPPCSKCLLSTDVRSHDRQPIWPNAVVSQRQKWSTFDDLFRKAPGNRRYKLWELRQAKRGNEIVGERWGGEMGVGGMGASKLSMEFESKVWRRVRRGPKGANSAVWKMHFITWDKVPNRLKKLNVWEYRSDSIRRPAD